jgi:hypothetical protein
MVDSSDNGAADILAKKPGQAIAIEVETGKSNTQESQNQVKSAGFDRVVLLATSSAAVTACQKAIDSPRKSGSEPVEMLSRLDISWHVDIHLLPDFSFAVRKLAADSYFVWAPGYLRLASMPSSSIFSLSLTPNIRYYLMILVSFCDVYNYPRLIPARCYAARPSPDTAGR